MILVSNLGKMIWLGSCYNVWIKIRECSMKVYMYVHVLSALDFLGIKNTDLTDKFLL